MKVQLPDRSTALRLTAYGLVALILLPFVFLLLAAVLNGFGSYVVVSNSMAPRFHSGDVVFVHETDPSAVETGDAIVYESADGQTVTHEVVEIVERDGNRYFRTKGLANEEPDPSLVGPGEFVGVVVFDVPYFGVVVTFLQSDVGVVTFVVVPAVLLVVTEVWSLVAAIKASGSDDETQVSPDGGSPRSGED